MPTLSIISHYAGGVLFAGSLSTACIVDLRCRQIPDACSVGLCAAALLRVLSGQVSIVSAIAALLIMGTLMLVMTLSNDALGGGDIKLMAAGAACVGLQSAFTAAALALTLALIYSGCLRLSRKWSRSLALPMAPFLLVGFGAVYYL